MVGAIEAEFELWNCQAQSGRVSKCSRKWMRLFPNSFAVVLVDARLPVIQVYQRTGQPEGAKTVSRLLEVTGLVK